jgi:hypothetical protein
MHDRPFCATIRAESCPGHHTGKGFAMKTRIALLCAALLYAGPAFSQLGVNCGERPGILRNRSGIIWFTSEQLEKMATKRVEPVMPSAPADFHYDGYVKFRILVDKKGEIGCIWAKNGHPMFIVAVNEALQYWEFKPMQVNGKPVEFVGVIQFHVHAN